MICNSEILPRFFGSSYWLLAVNLVLSHFLFGLIGSLIYYTLYSMSISWKNYAKLFNFRASYCCTTLSNDKFLAGYATLQASIM